MYYMRTCVKTQIFLKNFELFIVSIHRVISYFRYFYMDLELFLQELAFYGEKNKIPNISMKNAFFLRDILRITSAKNALEIGAANGFSALHFALELQKNDWKLMSIEFSSHAYTMAQENIQKTELSHIIELVYGNALDILPTLKNSFYDFVFIDGMKRRTKDFLELVWDKVRPSWVIVIDDVIKFEHKMLGLEDFLKEKQIIYHILPIDGDDGIMMIVK